MKEGADGSTKIDFIAEFIESNCWVCAFALKCKKAKPLPCFEEKDEGWGKEPKDVERKDSTFQEQESKG